MLVLPVPSKMSGLPSARMVKVLPGGISRKPPIHAEAFRQLWSHLLRVDLEHSGLLVLARGRGLQHIGLPPPVLPVHDLHRRLRRVRGGSGVARGIISKL